jgi:hypothetical protein
VAAADHRDDSPAAPLTDTGLRRRAGAEPTGSRVARAGVLGLGVSAYRDNGRQYVYELQKRVSALYVITRR